MPNVDEIIRFYKIYLKLILYEIIHNIVDNFLLLHKVFLIMNDVKILYRFFNTPHTPRLPLGFKLIPETRHKHRRPGHGKHLYGLYRRLAYAGISPQPPA